MNKHFNKLFAEFLGTIMLLTTIIGSGIMDEQLANGNTAIALLANTLATIFGLYVLIEIFAPISGAHFNPVVSLVMRYRGLLPAKLLLPYIMAQLAGALIGVWLTHLMFDMPVLQWSYQIRSSPGLWIAEIIATAGLIFTILNAPAQRIASIVALYIGAAYWFTASNSFANPAAVFGRMFTDSFTGIAPSSAPSFITAQFLGALLAVASHYLVRRTAV